MEGTEVEKVLKQVSDLQAANAELTAKLARAMDARAEAVALTNALQAAMDPDTFSKIVDEFQGKK